MAVKTPVSKGELTSLGYHASLSIGERHNALLRAVDKYGLDDVIWKLNAVAVLNKNKPVGKIFREDQQWVSNLAHGGLIGDVPTDKLGATRKLPPPVKKLIRMLMMTPASVVVPQGSFSFGIQPYPSDIDTISYINFENKPNIGISIANLLKAVCLRANNVHGWHPQIVPAGGHFFSDLKCGIDRYGNPLHWNYGDILLGAKIEDDYLLSDAVMQKSLCKVDMIAQLYGRYVEVSMIYAISIDGVPQNYTKMTTQMIVDSIKHDVTKQLEKNDYFKAIKRVYSIAKLINDTNVMAIVVPLLQSNVSKLATIASLLNTIGLMAKQNIPVSHEVANKEISYMLYQLSSVQDIDFDRAKITEWMGLLVTSIKEDDAVITIDGINTITSYIKEITNRETADYLHSIGIDSFDSFGFTYYDPEHFQG